MATLMCAVFQDTQSAEQALRALEASGFPRQQMDVRSGDELMHQKEQRRGERSDEVWNRVRTLFDNRGSSTQKSSAKDKEAASAAGEEASAIDDDEMVLVLGVADDRVGQAAEILGDTGAVDLDARLGGAIQGQAGEEPVYAVVIDEEIAIEEAITPSETAERPEGRAQQTGKAAPSEPRGEQQAGEQKQSGHAAAGGKAAGSQAPGRQQAGQQKQAGQERQGDKPNK